MIRPTLFVLAAVLLVAPQAASAGKLATTPVRSTADSDIVCNFVNTGKKAIEVVVRIRDLSGEILAESGSMSTAPGEGNGIGDNANDDYYGWCEFDIKGKAKGVRASLQLSPGSGLSPTLVVPAQ